MDETDDLLKTTMVGGISIADHLARAVVAGQVTRQPDGRFLLPEQESVTPYIHHHPHPNHLPSCKFLIRFAFPLAYGNQALPYHCHACYKIKIVSTSLRQLMAAKAIAESLPCPSKSGHEINNPTTPHRYGTYLYQHTEGLEGARALYAQAREPVNRHPLLGPETEMFIKRGCTIYERHLGPSDRYSIDPALEAVEALLQERVILPTPGLPKTIRDAMARMEMIEMAYRTGDETYKDFTGGRSLAVPVVRYDPDGTT